MKRILDTVHGYIMIRDEFFRYIIDTVYFQRLRRIEQTSIRSVYPSARHDRFIHSLGVFHIGSLIVQQLGSEAKENKYWGETETTIKVIFDSYLAACLLHDIAHAPFSHTFEKYYGQKSKLAQILKDEINNSCFSDDIDETFKMDTPNYHELMSAWLVCNKFKDGLTRMNMNLEFVARMITGVFYICEKDKYQIHNCFISLLHGRVIDADRLDYACRDVWASGYSTSNIDLRRLISALHLKRKDNDYVVCFESNAINEIEGLLNVKDFQVKYVLNHHTVSYEQWLLVKAAEEMALKYYPQTDLDNPGYLALQNILCKESIVDEVVIPNINVKISNVSDDDLVFLMKQDANNTFYEEWSSRRYNCYALWKSPDEFHHFFPGIKRDESLEHRDFEKVVKGNLIQRYGFNEDEIVITKAVYKPRVKMDSLYLIVANDVVRYTELYPATLNLNKDRIFYYVYVKNRFGSHWEDKEKERRSIIKDFKTFIILLYAPKNQQDLTELIPPTGITL